MGEELINSRSAPSVVAHQPVRLPANQPQQFYRGGQAIAALRGDESRTEFGPEDWIASITTRFGETLSGLSRLPDGRLLRDAVQGDPQTWLGPDHVAKFGADTALLVKLLDAGQRLPVHCHPSNSFAKEHFDSRYGKTEAWVVIGTDSPHATVYIGFRDDVTEDTITTWVTNQDHHALLNALNPVSVSPGDTVLIPAGLPHAIGAGVFVVELQQPTDLSITLEWDGFLANAQAGHLGIGFDSALKCVNRAGWGNERWKTLVRNTSSLPEPIVPLFGADADAFFRADRLQINAPLELDTSFAVLIVLHGTGKLRTEHGSVLDLRQGDTLVVPYSAGSSTVDGELAAVRCRPPDPRAIKEIG